jgi:hypothetical protein
MSDWRTYVNVQVKSMPRSEKVGSSWASHFAASR